MLPRRVTVQLLAFLVLSGGVAANVFFLQSSGAGRAARVSDATAWSIAAIEAAEFGDTGSLGHPRAPASGQGTEPWPRSPRRRTKATRAREVTRAVQRELQIRGYETGGRDGIVGIMTRGAIMAFEHDHGLPLTARPSEPLLKAIILGEGSKPRARSAKRRPPRRRK